MTRFNRDWVVRPHSSVIPLADGLVCVDGEIVFPLGRFPRRMTVARLAGGGTAVWSPIAVDDDAMRQLDTLGTPQWLVAPGISHRLDIAAWKQRFPQARVLCPPGAAQVVSEAVPVDATADPLGDRDLTFETVPGLGEHEAALSVRRGGTTSLVVNDIIANVRHPLGVGAKLMARLSGFGTRGPQMPRAVRKNLVSNAAALAAWLRQKAADPTLVRLIPAHGDVMEHEAVGTALRQVAGRLEG